MFETGGRISRSQLEVIVCNAEIFEMLEVDIQSAWWLRCTFEVSALRLFQQGGLEIVTTTKIQQSRNSATWLLIGRHVAGAAWVSEGTRARTRREGLRVFYISGLRNWRCHLTQKEPGRWTKNKISSVNMFNVSAGRDAHMAVRGNKCSHREAWTEYVYLCSCTKKLDMGANAVVEDKVAVKKLKWEEVEGVQRKIERRFERLSKRRGLASWKALEVISVKASSYK